MREITGDEGELGSASSPSISLHLLISISFLSELHDLLAEILALQEADEGAGGVLEAVGYGFAKFESARAHQARELFQRDGPAVQMVGDDEALELDAHADRHHQVLDAVAVIGGVVLRDHAAERNARE